MKILIADDNETNRKLVRASLKPEGHELVEVHDGNEAREMLLHATTPVVGLIDWEMPEVDGVEVCRQARQRPDAPPLFLILLTIRDKREDVVHGLTSGANDYVVKPFHRAELLARVKIGIESVTLQQTLLDQARAQQEALAQVKQLSGLLPICSYCKSIRDDKAYWHRLESYIANHTRAQFSHGVCPDCFKLHLAPHLE
jgi:DNA-binding response OmpR family regulator